MRVTNLVFNRDFFTDFVLVVAVWATAVDLRPQTKTQRTTRTGYRLKFVEKESHLTRMTYFRNDRLRRPLLCSFQTQ